MKHNMQLHRANMSFKRWHSVAFQLTNNEMKEPGGMSEQEESSEREKEGQKSKKQKGNPNLRTTFPSVHEIASDEGLDDQVQQVQSSLLEWRVSYSRHDQHAQSMLLSTAAISNCDCVHS
jgi:hypothetical protein